MKSVNENRRIFERTALFDIQNGNYLVYSTVILTLYKLFQMILQSILYQVTEVFCFVYFEDIVEVNCTP
jgi:hypothetical protein